MWRLTILFLTLFWIFSSLTAQENIRDQETNREENRMVLRGNTRDKTMICRNNMHQRMHQNRQQEMIRRNQMHMQRKMQMNQQRRMMQQQRMHQHRMQQQRIQQQRIQRQMNQQGAGPGR
ncbi:MAG: hypothetical protein JXB24_08795 [Bacteroidales bacterium]|jgi:hypothetical protein|nr:hypothetical protein [Bacteroidales bacterium]